MKKILALLAVGILSIGLVACGSENNSKKVNETNAMKTEEKSSLGVGEEFVFKKDGKDYYSIKINSVKVADNFEYKNDFTESNRKQIIEVNYTYKNIAKNDENKLLIHGADLKVMDSKGNVAQSSDMFPKQKPQETPVGANCTVQAYYGLENKSDKVRIVFSSETLKKTVEFEIPVK